MRSIKELSVFARHYDWWEYSKDGKYFVPTEKAPKEAVEAIKIVNKRIKDKTFA